MYYRLSILLSLEARRSPRAGIPLDSLTRTKLFSFRLNRGLRFPPERRGGGQEQLSYS